MSIDIRVALPRRETKLPSSGGAMPWAVRGRMMHWPARYDDRFKDCVVTCRSGRIELTFVWKILVMQVLHDKTSVMMF